MSWIGLKAGAGVGDLVAARGDVGDLVDSRCGDDDFGASRGGDDGVAASPIFATRVYLDKVRPFVFRSFRRRSECAGRYSWLADRSQSGKI